MSDRTLVLEFDRLPLSQLPVHRLRELGWNLVASSNFGVGAPYGIVLQPRAGVVSFAIPSVVIGFLEAWAWSRDLKLSTLSVGEGALGGRPVVAESVAHVPGTPPFPALRGTPLRVVSNHVEACNLLAWSAGHRSPRLFFLSIPGHSHPQRGFRL